MAAESFSRGDRLIRLTLLVSVEDGATAMRIAEQMARTATGLAFDGIDVSFFTGPEDVDEPEDVEP